MRSKPGQMGGQCRQLPVVLDMGEKTGTKTMSMSPEPNSLHATLTPPLSAYRVRGSRDVGRVGRRTRRRRSGASRAASALLAPVRRVMKLIDTYRCGMMQPSPGHQQDQALAILERPVPLVLDVAGRDGTCGLAKPTTKSARFSPRSISSASTLRAGELVPVHPGRDPVRGQLRAAPARPLRHRLGGTR